MQNSLNEAAAFLKSHDDYLILTHRRPDGDTVGSAAALCRSLRAIGKTAWIYPNPEFTPKFSTYLETLVADGQGPSVNQHTVISVDVASPGLFPFGAEDAAVALAIDHHGTNTHFAERTLVQPERAACGEIIWSLLPALGVTPTRALAEAVYVAVSTDTGCFRYSNVTADTLRVASDCVAAGADIFPINRRFFTLKRWPRLQLESELTRSTRFCHGGLVSVSEIPAALMDRLGLTEDDVDDVSGFGRSIEGVEIAVMLREVEGGKGKVSVRTGPAYNAAQICARLGGGGHAAAAGATVEGGIEAAKSLVLRAIDVELGGGSDLCQTGSSS